MMDPKDEIVSERWTTADGIKSLAPNNNDPVYGHLVTYRDGRVILTRYRRGTGDPNAQPVVPDRQEGSPETLPPDVAVKEAWDKAQPKPQTPGAAAADANAAELQRQREKNAALDPSLDPRYETDAERAARADDKRAAEKAEAARAAAAAEAAKPKPPLERPNPEDPTRRQRWDPAANGGQGAWVDSGIIAKPADPSKPPLTRVDPTNPNQQQKWDPEADGGRGGWVNDVPITKAPEKQETQIIDGVPHRIVRDAAGNVLRYEPIEISSEGTDPTFIGTMPTYIPKTIADDLDAYSKELAAAEKAGAITKARATALMDARLKAAQGAVDSELDAAQTIYQAGVTERGQSISQANVGLSASSTNFGKALDIATSINRRIQPGSDAGYRLFEALLREGQAQARAYGGLDKPPVTPIPAAVQRAANITVQAPDGTVVTIPSGVGTSSPQPPDPGMTQQQLLESVQRPDVVTPEQTPAPEAVSSGLPPGSQASRLLNPQPTGIAAIDSMGQQMAAPPPRTFASVEDKFREFGMDEDAIQASRRNFMGLGAA